MVLEPELCKLISKLTTLETYSFESRYGRVWLVPVLLIRGTAAVILPLFNYVIKPAVLSSSTVQRFIRDIYNVYSWPLILCWFAVYTVVIGSALPRLLVQRLATVILFFTKIPQQLFNFILKWVARVSAVLPLFINNCSTENLTNKVSVTAPALWLQKYHQHLINAVKRVMSLLIYLKVCFINYCNYLKMVTNKDMPSFKSPLKQNQVFLRKSLTYKIAAMLFVALYFFFMNLESNSWLLILAPQIAGGLVVYLLWQTAQYFLNLYQVSKYTTQVAGFWQRTLLVFWALEGIIFLIFVYVWFVSPDVPQMSLGQTQTLAFVNTCTPHIIKSFAWLFLLLSLSLTALLLKSFNNRVLQTLLVFSTFYIVSRSLLEEYLFFIYNLKTWSTLTPALNQSDYLSSITRASKVPTDIYAIEQILTNNVHIGETFKEEITSKSVMSTIWFLRFWHVLVVFFLFLLTTNRWLTTNQLSFEVLSAWIYNSIILIIFNALYFIYYVKIIGKEYLAISFKYYHLDSTSIFGHEILLELLQICI